MRVLMLVVICLKTLNSLLWSAINSFNRSSRELVRIDWITNDADFFRKNRLQDDKK